MGKVLESLKRRDAAHVPPEPRRLHPAAQVASAAAVVRPTTAWPEPVGFDPSEEGIPFIEVPEAPRPAEAQASSPVPTNASPVPEALPPIYFQQASDHERRAGRLSGELAMAAPDKPAAEQYRQAARAIDTLLRENGLRTLLICPERQDAILGLAALDLTLALADRINSPVLLIDAAGPEGRAAEHLELARAPGWTELLAGLTPPQVIQETGWRRLHLIAAGNRLARGRILLHGEKTARILNALADEYELVAILGGGIESPAPPLLLAEVVAASCLISRGGSNPAVLGLLSQGPARFLGTLTIARKAGPG